MSLFPIPSMLGAVTAVSSNDPEIEKTREFLRYIRTGMDINHAFLADFHPNSHDSIAKFRKKLLLAADERTVDNFFKSYLEEYARHNPVNWDSVFFRVEIGNAFMEEGENSFLWKLGFLVKQNALEFLEHSEKSCPDDRYECDDIYTELKKAGLIAGTPSLIGKIPSRVANQGMRYTFLDAPTRNFSDWIAARTRQKGIAGVDKKYLLGDLGTSELDGALPGYHLMNVSINRKIVGTIILGSPKDGARAGLRVQVGGRVTEDELEADYRGCLQYQGTLTMQSQESAVPLGTVIVNGTPIQTRFEANRQDGLVIAFLDGALLLADKRHFLLSDITRNPADRAIGLSITMQGSHSDQVRFLDAAEKMHITMLSAASFNPHIEGEKWHPENGNSQIRLIFTYEDGKFGMFNSDESSVNEMLAVLYRLQERFGRLKLVVRCDRGGWDSAAYYLSGKKEKKVQLGSVVSAPSNRIYFYSAPLCTKGGQTAR